MSLCLVLPISDFKPNALDKSMKQTASVAIRKSQNFCSLAIVAKSKVLASKIANDRDQLVALGPVTQSALLYKLETPTSKSLGQPRDKMARALISLEPKPQSGNDLLLHWENKTLPWNNRLMLQLDHADAQGTVRTPFLSKIKGLLNFTARENMTSIFDFWEPDTHRWDVIQISDSTLRLGQSGKHQWLETWQKHRHYWQHSYMRQKIMVSDAARCDRLLSILKRLINENPVCSPQLHGRVTLAF